MRFPRAGLVSLLPGASGLRPWPTRRPPLGASSQGESPGERGPEREKDRGGAPEGACPSRKRARRVERRGSHRSRRRPALRFPRIFRGGATFPSDGAPAPQTTGPAELCFFIPPQNGEGRQASSKARCEPGWGLCFEENPTRPLASLASTLPLQGREKEKWLFENRIRALRLGRHRFGAAFAQDELQIAQINENAKGLPENKDRIP